MTDDWPEWMKHNRDAVHVPVTNMSDELRAAIQTRVASDLAEPLLDLLDRIAALEAERDEAIYERNLAREHDRQPYPAAAYEEACAALDWHRERATALEAELARLRDPERLAAALREVLGQKGPKEDPFRRHLAAAILAELDKPEVKS